MRCNELFEGFVSNLTNLSTKELEEKYHDKFGKNEKIFASKFVKLKNKTDAIYVILTYDADEEEYLVNELTLSHSVQKGIMVDDVTPVPSETFKKSEVAKAKDYISKY